MKEDPLSELLKEHADLYQVSPQAGSFDGVVRKRAVAARRKRIAFWFSASMVAALVLVAGLVFWGEEKGTKNNGPVQPEEMAYMPSDEKKETPQQTGSYIAPQPTEASIQPATVNPNTPSAVSSSTTVAKKVKQINKQPQAAKVIESYAGVGGHASPAVSPIIPVNVLIDEKTPVVSSTLPVATTSAVDTATKEAARPAESEKQQVLASILSDTTIQMAAAIPPVPALGKWSVAAMFTALPVGNAYSANSTADLLWLNKKFDSSDRMDRSRISYATGIKVQKQLNKHWGVSAGLLVSQVMFQDIPFNVTERDTVIKSNTASPGPDNKLLEDMIINQTALYRYDRSYLYLEVPVAVSYRQQKNKWIYEASVGVSVSQLIHTKTYFFDSTTAKAFSDVANPRFNKRALMLQSSLSAGYCLTPKLCVYGGPSFRYNPSGFYSNKNDSYFMLGVEAGVKFLF